MIIEVTGCHDCPFRMMPRNECDITGEYVFVQLCLKTFHPSCPLQTEPITIKKKEDDAKS